VRGWLAARVRAVSARIDRPLAFGAGLLGVGLLAGVGLGASLDAARLDAAGTSGVVAGSAGLPFGARMADAAGPVRAAVGFVGVWARPRQGWHETVRALATPELAAALDVTDTGALPDADPTGRPQVRSLAEDSALVAVPLSTGRTVVVTVVASGGSWLVNDVEPDTGNW
jgi:hypothetical protein